EKVDRTNGWQHLVRDGTRTGMQIFVPASGIRGKPVTRTATVRSSVQLNHETHEIHEKKEEDNNSADFANLKPTLRFPLQDTFSFLSWFFVCFVFFVVSSVRNAWRLVSHSCQTETTHPATVNTNRVATHFAGSPVSPTTARR